MTRNACVLAALAAMLVLPPRVMAQKYDGVAVKSGQAALTYGGKTITLAHAEGGLQQVGGFTMATLVFRLDAKSKVNTHLNLTLMYNAPGKVDLDSAFSTSGIGMFMDADVGAYKKGKSRCTITLTKATPIEVEGTAECPLLHNIEGKVMPALTVQTFSATAK